MYQSRGTRKMLATPREKGEILVKLEVNKMRDLKVSKKDHWTKATFEQHFYFHKKIHTKVCVSAYKYVKYYCQLLKIYLV